MQILLYLGIGLFVGAVSGSMGIGGGVILVPALVWLCAFDPHKATGTSLAILAMPIAVPAAIQAFRRDEVEPHAALWIAGAFLVGAFLTRTWIDHLPVATLRVLFGLLMMWIAVRFMLSSDSAAASAAAGLTAVTLGWISFVALRTLGRQHLPPPTVGEAIERMHQQGRGDPDYYI
jgi:hypothetical protein